MVQPQVAASAAQPNPQQQSVWQPPAGNANQQPNFQQQPNYNGAVAPQAGVPSTYQVPGQYSAGQYAPSQYAQGQYGPGQYGYDTSLAPGVAGYPTSPENALAPGVFPSPNDPNSVIATQPFTPYQPRERIAPLDVYLQEARTGRVMLGGSVNSDLGLSGQLTIDERNFDITKLPTSWDDVWSGRAFRGRGQNFRAELMPGTRVQRYTVNWSATW